MSAGVYGMLNNQPHDDCCAFTLVDILLLLSFSFLLLLLLLFLFFLLLLFAVHDSLPLSFVVVFSCLTCWLLFLFSQQTGWRPRLLLPTGWLLLHSSWVNFYFCFCFSYPLVCCTIYFCHSLFSSASASLVDCYFPHRLDGNPGRLIVLIIHRGWQAQSGSVSGHKDATAQMQSLGRDRMEGSGGHCTGKLLIFFFYIVVILSHSLTIHQWFFSCSGIYFLLFHFTQVDCSLCPPVPLASSLGLRFLWASSLGLDRVVRQLLHR